MVRLHEPELRGGDRSSRRARTTASSRAAIAASRRTSCRGATRTSSASSCRRISANQTAGVDARHAAARPQTGRRHAEPVWQIDRAAPPAAATARTSTPNCRRSSASQPPVQTLGASGAATLTVSATDDGLPQRRGQSRSGMTVMWAKYRGPGTVTFGAPQASSSRRQGVDAPRHFSEPGEYMLQAVVDDGSGESAGNFGYHCCWTNTQVKVTVERCEVARSACVVERAGAAHLTFARISRRSSRRSARLPSRRHVGADVADDLRRSAARGRARSSSASPAARCRRGIWTRPSASVSTRTIAR